MTNAIPTTQQKEVFLFEAPSNGKGFPFECNVIFSEAVKCLLPYNNSVHQPVQLTTSS